MDSHVTKIRNSLAELFGKRYSAIIVTEADEHNLIAKVYSSIPSLEEERTGRLFAPLVACIGMTTILSETPDVVAEAAMRSVTDEVLNEETPTLGNA